MAGAFDERRPIPVAPLEIAVGVPAHTLLTPAEREVFLRMKDGKQDKQIADELGMAERTPNLRAS